MISAFRRLRPQLIAWLPVAKTDNGMHLEMMNDVRVDDTVTVVVEVYLYELELANR